VLGQWGKAKPRVLASEAMWQKPLKWDREAAMSRVLNGTAYRPVSSDDETLYVVTNHSGIRIARAEWEKLPRYRPRVFCASLADWLDNEVPIEWLIRLLSVIAKTRHLDWLLLTKRLENLRPRMEAVMRYFNRCNITVDEALARVMAEAWLTTGGTIFDNVWLGTTVEDQTRANERIPLLLSIHAKVRFLSCEPLLGPVNVSEIRDSEGFEYMPLIGANQPEPRIHWVICGGESGPKARPMHPDWARSLRDQCAAAGVPFFFKQWGEWGCIKEGAIMACTTERPKPWQLLRSDDVIMGRAQMRKVGKAKAGRLLDGELHNEFPKLEGGSR
jgi:protein gp37